MPHSFPLCALQSSVILIREAMSKLSGLSLKNTIRLSLFCKVVVCNDAVNLGCIAPFRLHCRFNTASNLAHNLCRNSLTEALTDIYFMLFIYFPFLNITHCIEFIN